MRKKNIILDAPIKKVLTLRTYIRRKWIESDGELVDIVNPAHALSTKCPSSDSYFSETSLTIILHYSLKSQ